MPQSQMPTTVGPYHIEREIGRGGMGVVYLARDPRLDRAVAIKALPAEFASDPARLARFQREARVVASLSHPHIAAVFGLEESFSDPANPAASAAFIVMEFVDGPTLGDRLATGPLALDEALTLAAQIAAGVEAAHEAGVIHRDLKPGNIKLTADGRAKVLDFGLAREVVPPSTPTAYSGREAQPTATSPPPRPTQPVTNAGAVMGTVGYMSPEQARGRTVDRRADIFAFGCVLHEMLTGRAPFAGSTQADVLAALLEREVDLTKLPPRTPRTVRELLARCLEKDPNRRLRDIGDARLVLQEAVDKRLWSATSLGGIPATSGLAPHTRRRLALAATLLVGVGLGAAALTVLRPTSDSSTNPGTTPTQPAALSRISITFPEALKPDGALQLAPDGRSIAYIAQVMNPSTGKPVPTVCVRPLDSFEPRRLPGTDHVLNLAYATDSKSVLIVTRDADDQGIRYVWRVAIDGATPPVRLLVRQPIAEGQSPALEVIGLDGGDALVTDNRTREFIRLRPGRDTPVSQVAYTLPDRIEELNALRLLPDGNTLHVTSFGYGPEGFVTFADLFNINTGKHQKRLANALGSQIRDNVLYLLRDRALFAARFDPGSLEIMGDPVPVNSEIVPTSQVSFRVADDGSLGYRAQRDPQERRWLGIVDPATGLITQVESGRRAYGNRPRVSLDGRRFAVQVERPDRLFEVWGGSLDQQGLAGARRLYSVPGADAFVGPLSPNGDRILVGVFAGAGFEVRVVNLDQPDQVSMLFRLPNSSEFGNAASWSHNPNKVFVSFGKDRTTGSDRTVLVDTTQGPIDPASLPPILPGKAVASSVYCSPLDPLNPADQWITYAPIGTGRSETLLVRWKDDQPVGAPLRVPLDDLEHGASFAGPNLLQARLRDGSRVRLTFKAEADGRVTFGTPEVAMTRETDENVNAEAYTALPDGRMLAILNEERGPARPVFNIVQNFAAEVQAKLAKSAPPPKPSSP